MADILAWIVFLFVDLLGLYQIFLLVEVPFGIPMKISKPLFAVFSGVFMIAQVLTELLGTNDTFWCVFIEFTVLIAMLLCFAQKKRFWAILLLIPATLIYYEWGVIFDMIAMLFGFYGKVMVTLNGVDVSYYMFIEEISLFVLLIILKRYANKKEMRISLTIPEGIFITVICFFSPILLEIMIAFDEAFKNRLFSMSWLIFGIGLNVAIIYMIAYRKRAAYYKGLSKHYREQFDAEFAYFLEYKKKNKDIAQFRHDWNNHMNMMQSMFDSGKYDEAKEYFNALPGVKSRNGKKILSGNEAVDMVLSMKVPIMEEHNIDFIIEGNLSGISHMATVDICTVFFNLVDNAIEAAMKCEKKRYLNIRVKENAGMTLIIFENAMVGELIKDGEQIRTTKTEEGVHGLGLLNVVEVLHRYEGEYEIETEPGRFVIRLMLPVREE